MTRTIHLLAINASMPCLRGLGPFMLPCHRSWYTIVVSCTVWTTHRHRRFKLNYCFAAAGPAQDGRPPDHRGRSPRALHPARLQGHLWPVRHFLCHFVILLSFLTFFSSLHNIHLLRFWKFTFGNEANEAVLLVAASSFSFFGSCPEGRFY